MGTFPLQRLITPEANLPIDTFNQQKNSWLESCNRNVCWFSNVTIWLFNSSPWKIMENHHAINR